MERHLVAFVRAPRLGTVKTRLAAGIGTGAAWIFYRRTASRVLRPLLTDRRWRSWLAVTPDAAATGRFPWPSASRIIRQGPGNLGDRMARVMAVLPPGPVVIIGVDAPDLAPAHVEQAFRALGECDTVFGPSADGGYWLVGLRRRPRILEIFAGVRWSTEHAFDDTIANLPAAATTAMLDELIDIDDVEALEHWRLAQINIRN
ncbi:MAG: hypothetical protein CFH05_00898 [Alphaproteobacteria bacterium MarineAlpha3_Bin4]|nr:MAG: hypothetical protein CFH05_00898 [Alphaproteobacteria bacterium MarineAlpha3_Bin4]